MQPKLLKIISFIAILINLSACAEIDKSLYAISNTVAPADRVTGARTVNLASRSLQIQKSNEDADQAIKQYVDKGQPINEKVDQEKYKKLVGIFNRVHSVSHLKDEKWKVFLLPDTDWNAFVTGGTYIFVNKGLMDELKSDDELAAVIGHEIAHITANHIYEQSSYTMAAKLNASKSIKDSSFHAAFTLKNEEEADKIGVMYMALAGYNPYAAADVWKRQYDNRGDYSAMTINHPVNSQRYSSTLALANQYKEYYKSGEINPDSSKVLSSVLSQNNTNQVVAGQGGGLISALEATTEMLLKNKEVKLEQAKQKRDQQLILYVTRSIVISDRRATPDNILEVNFVYKGRLPIKNLNLTARVNEEISYDHSPQIIQPRSRLTASFKFESVDLNKINLRDIAIKVAHVEQP